MHDRVRETQVVPLEQALEAGDLAEDLAELTIGQVPIRELVVEDVDDDDPHAALQRRAARRHLARGLPVRRAACTRDVYEREKRLLQIELLKLQNWVKDTGERIVIVFEGRTPPARAARSSASWST